MVIEADLVAAYTESPIGSSVDAIDPMPMIRPYDLLRMTFAASRATKRVPRRFVRTISSARAAGMSIA